MTSVGRYVRTAATLEPAQLGARLVHEARMRLYRLAPRILGTRFAPDRRATATRIRLDAPPLDLLGREATVAARHREGRVEIHGLAGPRDDWRCEGKSRLWRYERQYHPELVAMAAMHAAAPLAGWADDARRFVRSWADACPPVTPDAWEPYPVARRILNWSLAMAVAPDLAPDLAPRLLPQLRFLAAHLEHHLRGNHLLCDAAALVAGGAVLEGGGEWRERGEQVLALELGRQVLPDGGHAERTAQYHTIVLQDVVLAAALASMAGHPVGKGVLSPAGAMARWLAAVVRPDGSVPYLNDAAPDAMPDVASVLATAAALGVVTGPWDGWLARSLGRKCGEAVPPARADLQLPDTGWSLVREGAHELLFEHGPIGPREQPGHGHSDGLSYELIWDGAPVVLDTGVTTYQEGPLRDHERSVRAHACASVEGSPPDELWAAFRVGARAEVALSSLAVLPHGGRLRAGQLRAPGGWTHRRAIAFWPGRAMVVFDRVTGVEASQVAFFIPLAPGLEVTERRVRGLATPLDLVIPVGTLEEGSGWIGQGFERRVARRVLDVSPDRDGRACHAFLVPGCSILLEDHSCTIALPGADVRLGLDADGLPS